MMRSFSVSALSLCLGACAALLMACGSSESPAKSATAGAGTGNVSGAAGSDNSSGAPGSSGSGASNSSGSPGAGGNTDPPPPPPPAVDCTKLSTVVGQWQNISPKELLNPVNMENYTIVASPADGTIFATGGNATNSPGCVPAGTVCPKTATGILRSNDCGATWAKVNENTPGTDGANLETGSLWAMLLDHNNPQTLYVANGYGTNPTMYKSTDGGIKWKALKIDPDGKLSFVQAIALSPYDSKQLAVTFHESCCTLPKDPPVAGIATCGTAGAHKVLCFSGSYDGGETWKVFDGPSSIPGWDITGWMEGASISILGKTSFVFSGTAGVWYSGDTGATWSQIAADIIYGSYPGTTTIAGGTLFIAAGGRVLASPAAAGDPPFELGTTKKVNSLANSPLISSLVSDGVTLFTGSNREGMNPMWTAPLSDTTAWKNTTDKICGPNLCRGPNEMAYDPIHHLIYSANWGAGLWRYVIK